MLSLIIFPMFKQDGLTSLKDWEPGQNWKQVNIFFWGCMYRSLISGNEKDAALFWICHPRLGLYNRCLDSLYKEKLALLAFILNPTSG